MAGSQPTSGPRQPLTDPLRGPRAGAFGTGRPAMDSERPGWGGSGNPLLQDHHVRGLVQREPEAIQDISPQERGQPSVQLGRRSDVELQGDDVGHEVFGQEGNCSRLHKGSRDATNTLQVARAPQDSKVWDQ